MRVLLGLAASAAIALVSPAQAQTFGTATFGASNANPWVTTLPRVHRHHGEDGHMRGDHHGGPALAYGYGYGYGEYSDFDGNRGFDPDKWNDWWHDRPDRAYPRWMSRNADCTRRWFSGDMPTC